MKVYVVYEDWGSYEGCSCPLAVFSTEELAKKCCKKDTYYRYYEELEIDKEPDGT